ncbi:ATP-dependent nuclease [Burkholderia cepacia]|uniref:ATP-dependent nuclease n=1 Tax=Burkholderia cepacia TaxID=292 RepID=UPI0009BCD645|nr:ATP-binding protein [Burkholderia cepacia]
MNLSAFSVTNYRSITGTSKFPVGDFAVIIGKNNEGKSNILRALAVSMKILTTHGIQRLGIRPRDTDQYNWRRDFPISLQLRKRELDSKFRLEFSLTPAEVDEFRNSIKSNLNGTLPIEISIGKDNEPQIKVLKKGPGGAALSKKSGAIARYIAERIDFNYIPAVRTEDEAEAVVQDMLSKELATLEKKQPYIDALEVISQLQQPILEKLGKAIKKSLTDFLPNISSVHVVVPATARRLALRSQCKVEIDDGSRTLLEHKGDGVKSLAALGLLRNKQRASGAASVIAIEEPESHLHPGAIHGLREVILNLVAENQVLITTHCPLFADRENISRNILIDSNSAKPARSIASVRELLGVRASDNLVNASHVLVVEGAEDVIALRSILPFLSAKIGQALRQNLLVIEPIGGAGKLDYKLSMLANALCMSHVVLDNDEAGRESFEKAINANLLKLADLTLINCRGMANAEMEDCFELESYREVVKTEFGVDLGVSAFRGNAKWSDRVKGCFVSAGKPWGDRIKARVKDAVARAVAASASTALNVHKRQPIDALVVALEDKLTRAGY